MNTTTRISTRIALATMLLGGALTATAASNSAQAAHADVNVSAISQLAKSVSQGGVDLETAERAAAAAPSVAQQAAEYNEANNAVAQFQLAESRAIAARTTPDQGTVTKDETGWIGAYIGSGGAPLAGVKVVLDGPTKAVTYTRADGNYSFSNVIPGAYRAWVQLPEGYTVNGASVVIKETSIGAAGLDRSMSLDAKLN